MTAVDLSIHIPVLTSPLLKMLNPAGNELGIDCTIGLGGHAKAILDYAPSVRLIGLDMDTNALSESKKNLAGFEDRIDFFHANFAEIPQVLAEKKIEAVDFLYADIGVSSMQIDQPERGFSFQQDGPLDMRMDSRIQKRAADLVNSLKEPELADLIFKYGQEGKSKKIAKQICQARHSHRIDSTAELARIVCLALNIDPDYMGKQRLHPATKTFQALRIAVNDELGNLEKLLRLAPNILKKGGRLAVICFHSLEDRLVKDDFRSRSMQGQYEILTPKPLEADASEILRNPRSRSAKLRVVQKVL